MSLKKKNKYKLIALIPARSGSERIKNKNITNFCGHPLIAYSINSALKSKIFDKVVVSTDSQKYSKIAKSYGGEVPFLRPKTISGASSSDFEWVNFTISELSNLGLDFSHFFILRPTNPFRKSDTIKRAWKYYLRGNKFNSLRAVEVCNQHPYKMWTLKNGFLNPLSSGKVNNQPFYNSQTKALPKIFVQNASLEVSNISVLRKYKTITSSKIIPFYTKKNEGFDINYPYDLMYAKHLIKSKKANLDKINYRVKD